MSLSRRGFLVLGATGAVVAGAPPLGVAQAAAESAAASRTQRMYLTGPDADHQVDWDFMCTSGRRRGVWGTIPTPSNWEFHGYGTYNYGWNLVPEEKGHYRHTFTPPGDWRGRRVFLVFEGAMTDTEARINGELAGPVHRGGFYRFRYEVTGKLAPGEANVLEVTVSKESADTSVNNAERLGDYWNFGGIYRPVYLESAPAQHIERIAVDARADGTLRIDAYLSGAGPADRLVAQVTDRSGRPVGMPFTVPVPTGATSVTLSTAIDAPRQWTAETPHLYRVEVALNSGGHTDHRVSEMFGFRTIEVRPHDGVYVNGVKVLLKGANRHTIWPTSGRATSARISREDILLMKEMNMNAVRMSHYPPDTHFLDLADELGLYVLDELAGWQKSYSEEAGAPLVASMVNRDVNHPSILFWCNANEGGWNTALDDDYGLYDPQQRTVLHPWANFGGINTDHYESYESTRRILQEGSDIFMPTEFLHGLYDGGHGAGLEDYWTLMGHERLSAGGFLWALLDEGVVRDDQDGSVDVAGNAAPDGILGPFREKEASFYTVKDIWSPVQLTEPERFASGLPSDFDGRIGLANHYAFTNTRRCRFAWRLLDFPTPSQGRDGHAVRDRGTASAPDIEPGQDGVLRLRLPSGWRRADALALSVTDSDDREIQNWTWIIPSATEQARRLVSTGRDRAVQGAVEGGRIVLTSGHTTVSLDAATGMLAGVRHRGTPFSFTNGPLPTTGTAELVHLTHGLDADGYAVEAEYSGVLRHVRWCLTPSGWLRLDYRYHLTGEHDFFGVGFDHPESEVSGVTWLGRGPYRVWKNRLRGVTPDVWTKTYNDTATGADGWEYPEFKGYHADVRWASLHTAAGRITMVSENENLFLRLFTPRFGPDPRYTAPPFPTGDLSFLDAIPAIGTKFDPPAALGPSGGPNTAAGDYSRTLFFAFTRTV
ncbi:glycoside hydrolase family 2 TIM barrel-domain containing protein [Streptomyces litchfieldiae]|uniref:beta-galactosidase n=1 Tax=Streptomyces litchfieldiae TaxID=3075543 RepID=A0ABU2MS55_9ACTN|nr:glycoside hydrolase family 2 TIM barrel-domain containing protein [Streptomyces sp. DSM 44938]MDT0344450.1 glycoside hydrolase family 2 TIM barrel-domain containing protein [Streptomyces sp. DSM 44938]